MYLCFYADDGDLTVEVRLSPMSAIIVLPDRAAPWTDS